MKTTPFPQVIVLLLIASMIGIVVKSVLTNVDLNALQAASITSHTSAEQTKSAIWYVSNRDEALKHIKECRKDISLSYTKNCINAEYAIKIIGQ
ncbi:MAG: EexN family lipoprotein [Methylococcaceae bacterium]|nr:EexN family lipoprotein [Methylococcaceae bacterium]MDP3903405.1 EexN family lipoprotein [Methylococcaceae bacterium]